MAKSGGGPMIVLLFLWSLAFAETPVTYIRNYDGDTITFNIGKVRVLGIDAPEMKSKRPCESSYGKISQKYVEDRLKKARKIIVTNHENRDIYGRILADVYIDGVSLKEMLLKENLAVIYVPKKWQKVNWCKIQEKRHESKKL